MLTEKHTSLLADGLDIQKDILDELKGVKDHEKIVQDKQEHIEVVLESSKTAPVKKFKDKGVIFSSSIGQNMNKMRLEAATNSEIEIVTTYHLTKTDTAKDPELHLLPMVAKHVTDEIDFVGICVGTNDTTDMNNDWVDEEEIMEKCKKQAQILVDTAENIVTKNKDVYLIEQPPRYDSEAKDPKGNWARYAKLVNSNLALLAAGKNRIHIVENSNLARLPGKGREELYTDGLHLSKKGLYTLETNIIMTMHKVKPGLSSLDVHVKKSPAVKHDKSKKATSVSSGGHYYPPPGYLGGPGQVGGQGGHHHQQYQQQQQQYYQQQQQQQYWAPEQWNSYGHPQYYNQWGGW